MTKRMPQSIKTLLTGLILAGWLLLPAFARDALSPQEAPELFFESVWRMDYVQAWQVLTSKSQERIIKLVGETEKDNKLSAAALRKLFESGDRAVQRGFWTQLRQGMDIEAWNKQSFGEPRAGEQAGESYVRVKPAGIWVYVHQENQGWKFGYVESFVERRRPKGEPAANQPVPSPVPPGTTGNTPGGTQR